MQSSERINEILLSLGIKAPTFAKRIGVKYQRILDVQNGRVKKISGEVANHIVNTYPQFDINWLLTGEGSMLKTTDQLINREGDGASPSEVDPNNLSTMKSFFDALERRDREIEAQGRRMDRLITIIEKMSGVAGAEIEALKKEG